MMNSNILELKRVSFQHVKKALKQIDTNYPFVMPIWLLTIITIIGTFVLVIVASMIWYFK